MSVRMRVPSIVGHRAATRLASTARAKSSWRAVPDRLSKVGPSVHVEDQSDRSRADLPRTALDESSKAWVAGLQATGRAHEECVSALHALLLRVARHEVSRRSASLQVRGPELDDVAQQATDDALMAIRSKVSGFRGESRFTTWAYRFVMFEVSTKMGRHFWRDHRAALDDDDWERIPDTLVTDPAQQSVHGGLFAALRRAIDEDLTERQRRVFVAIALNEVPMDAFARELGASRNAIYKCLFDARRRLRASLSSAGYEPPYAALGS
jgi:RNA polymerase sigma-70 factor, ECF subfamily